MKFKKGDIIVDWTGQHGIVVEARRNKNAKVPYKIMWLNLETVWQWANNRPRWENITSMDAKLVTKAFRIKE